MAEREDAKELHIRPRGVHSPKPIDGSRLQPPTGGSGLAPTVPRPGSVEGPKLVVEELNELHAEADRLRSRVAELEELSDNRRHRIKQMAAVLGGLRQEIAGLRAENERLLAACDGYKHDVIYARAELGKIAHTNASLRAILESFMKGLIDPGPDRGFYKILIHRCDIENARAALGGEPSDLVMVRRSFLVPFARIAERLDACESSCKLLDSAHLAKPLDDIPEGVAYISLGMVQELARLVRGDR